MLAAKVITQLQKMQSKEILEARFCLSWTQGLFGKSVALLEPNGLFEPITGVDIRCTINPVLQFLTSSFVLTMAYTVPTLSPRARTE